jgi:ribosomal protein L33
VNAPAPTDAAPPPPPAVFCDHCGERLDTGAHERCVQLRRMEPPRYCPHCRRRMVVQVVPRGWAARCVEHGEITDAPNG